MEIDNRKYTKFQQTYQHLIYYNILLQTYIATFSVNISVFVLLSWRCHLTH